MCVFRNILQTDLDYAVIFSELFPQLLYSFGILGCSKLRRSHGSHMSYLMFGIMDFRGLYLVGFNMYTKKIYDLGKEF